MSHHTAPRALRVLTLLRARVPQYSWNARRVVQACKDFDHYIDVEEVAARCADWMTSGHVRSLKDPEGTLRGFFEKAKAQSYATRKEPAPDSPLRTYDRPENSDR